MNNSLGYPSILNSAEIIYKDLIKRYREDHANGIEVKDIEVDPLVYFIDKFLFTELAEPVVEGRKEEPSLFVIKKKEITYQLLRNLLQFLLLVLQLLNENMKKR